MRRSSFVALLVATAAALPIVAACSRSESGAGAGADSAAGDSAVSAVESPDWTVTAKGIGPVRAGMTLAEVGEVLGAPVSQPHPGASCDYAFPPALPPGVALMVVDGRVARIDVDSASVRTAEGAHIGDTEAEIQAAYAGRVEVQPHKYVGSGHYLVVTPRAPADSAYRLIFETDGRVVTRFRAGLLPQVRWIEGCS